MPEPIFSGSTGALNTAAGITVTLAGGASACDVFWNPDGATTIGANNNFIGTVIPTLAAAHDITVLSTTLWTGRALTFGHTVTTPNSNVVITVPTCAAASATLNIIKHVINNNGGIKNAGDFTLTIGGVTAVGGNTVTGAESPGVSKTLSTFGAYTVTETDVAGYSQSSSADCSGTIVAGETKTCTITNDDIVAPASINVAKIVVNDNGRTKIIADFSLFVNGTSVISGVTNVFSAPADYVVTETADSQYARTFSGDCDINGHLSLVPGDTKFCIITNDDIAIVTPPGVGGSGTPTVIPPVPPLIDVVKVPSPLALPAGPGPVTYTYTLRNVGTVPVTNITMVGDTCSPIVLISGDTNADAKLDINEIWTYRCSTTLSKTHTNIVTATGWANGISAIDIASATVIVGSPFAAAIVAGLPVVPPLIHVTKIPSPLVLFAGGGMITYTEKVTNPGTVALSNVRLTDDKCDPVKYISGDTNGNSKLDTSETWTYTCQTKLTKTTTNTVTASGDANDMTARDLAIATVVVTAAVPALPNTGIPPAGESTLWGVVIFFGILILFSISLVVVLRKRTI